MARPTRNLWRVAIRAHEIPPRWSVPKCVYELGSGSSEYAANRAVKWAHSDAGVPPLRSLVALSLEHVTITRVAREVEGFR